MTPLLSPSVSESNDMQLDLHNSIRDLTGLDLSLTSVNLQLDFCQTKSASLHASLQDKHDGVRIFSVSRLSVIIQKPDPTMGPLT